MGSDCLTPIFSSGSLNHCGQTFLVNVVLACLSIARILSLISMDQLVSTAPWTPGQFLSFPIK
eukprot:4337275-Pyramimonas_sp.AAC.1